jgi:hypothetical protein
MGKRLGVLSAALAVAALVVGLALPAAGSASNGGTHHTFRVVAITTELNLLDLGAKGPSLHGDAQSRDC